MNSSSEISENVRRQVITGLRDTPMRPVISESGLESSSGWVYRFPYDPNRMSDKFTDEMSNEETNEEAAAIESAAIQAQ